ncbi:MAG: hypothetical protein EXX96DRAFT_654660 [Benjaminiella poitrasii]|nr:MAG: hypothetical protein EXX96DRAFT_654660 [Benjaminiella poitrasii]
MSQNFLLEKNLLSAINISDQDEWSILPSSLHSSSPPSPPQTPPHDSDTNTIITRQLSLTRNLSELTNDDQACRKEVINISTSNPSHLFWVPASQHPEIAPTEFEKYVKAHGLIIRRKSEKRRQSILSVYFTAVDEQVTADTEAVATTTTAAIETTSAENRKESNHDDDYDRKRRSMLRRSLSLQITTAGEYARNVPDLLIFDRNSSPLDKSRALVPKADRPLLRRGARTNFKRNSSLNKSPAIVTNSNQQDDYCYQTVPYITTAELNEGSPVTLTDSTIKENSDTQRGQISVDNDHVRDLCIATRHPEYDTIKEQQEQQQQQQEQQNQAPSPFVISRSVSTLLPSSNNSSNSSRKSSWSWTFWLDEKSGKKINKVDPSSPEEDIHSNSRPASTSFETSSSHSKKLFTLSSLFSRKSKSNSHSQQNYASNIDMMTSSVLNQQQQNNQATKNFQLHNPMYMTRLPLHVERAIYRLSHIKLANPRRPLHEQVLISNQMFWYLSVIASDNAVDPVNHDSTPIVIEEKKRRKRLVKKQRMPPPSNKKTNVKATTKFMSSNRTESTGFVVPDNYLNPSKQSQLPSLKTSTNRKNRYHVSPYHKQQRQSSDSSSSEDDDDNSLSSDEEEDDEVPRTKNGNKKKVF